MFAETHGQLTGSPSDVQMHQEPDTSDLMQGLPMLLPTAVDLSQLLHTLPGAPSQTPTAPAAPALSAFQWSLQNLAAQPFDQTQGLDNIFSGDAAAAPLFSNHMMNMSSLHTMMNMTHDYLPSI
jgi:hypothetical protein